MHDDELNPIPPTTIPEAVERAAVALAITNGGIKPTEPEDWDVLEDLLIDLRHYADNVGRDWNDLLALVDRGYEGDKGTDESEEEE